MHDETTQFRYCGGSRCGNDVGFRQPAVAQPVIGLDASYMSGEGEVLGPGDLDGSGTAQ